MQRVCVFCGSRPGTDPAFADAARDLGVQLAQRRLQLVYGGSGHGLMGELARACLAAGGEAVGVLPRGLIGREPPEGLLTELELVDSMHDRKTRMAERADAFLALPGGLGTLEELFECLTWLMLGIHDKPCGLLDVNGYYARLITFLDGAVDAGFILPAHRQLLLVDSRADRLLDRMERWVAPSRPAWLGPDET